MNRMTAILLFFISITVLAGCEGKIRPGEHEIVRPVVEGVTVKEVQPLEVTDFYESSGTLRASTISLVSAKIMGEVKDIKANIGDKVKKGDVLLVIYSPDIQAKFEAGREALGEAREGLAIAGNNKDLAEKTFQRFRQLYEGKAITEQEFDEIKTKRDIAMLRYKSAENALKRAKAALDEAEAFRDYSIIRSPVSGTIAEKKIDVGSMAVPGAPLFIVEKSAYRVEASVDEGLISSVEVGSPVSLSIDALNIHTTGTVGEMVRRIDPMTRTFLVKIDIKDAVTGLRGGLYARVRFPLGRRSYLFVNESSIVRRGELKGVYSVDADGVVKLRLVKTGKKRDGLVEILSGLDKGDRIIVSGVEKAVDGGVVK